NDSVAKRQIPLEDIERSISFVEKKPSELANLNAYGYLQEEPLKAKVNEIRSLVLDKMDPAAFEKKKSGLLTQKQRLIDLYDSISTLIAKLEAISPGKNDSDSVWREFVLDSLPLMVAKSLPEGSEIIDYAGIQELNDRVGERMPLGELKERFRRTAEKLDGSAKAMKIFIGIFDKIQSIPMPRANYFDTLIGYRNIVKITAKAISPGKADDAIRNVKILLDGLVVKDTVAVRLVGEYDKYLSLWLMNSRTTRDSTRDTLALLFLQRFLPALRNASFSDSGIKKLYKRSIPLIGFVKLPDIKSAQENIASDPLLSLLIPWVASYSTRTRSQNLQAAVQLMRDNDTLFAKLIPSSSTREWIWLITDGFDIDTAKDVISVEIPKLLTKIEKKYQNEVKAASLPIYPILDIGIFSAVAYGKDTTDFIQVASEKVGFGFAFWRAKSTPTEALIEDPYDRSGEAGVSFVEKAGLEFHASGLLYNSTNMKTNKSFNDALFSFGLGVYFRLGITARVAYGWGYNHGDLQHRVLQAAMDVPLADYLVELGKKN
ncbi:MAG TPA: hypothetical protein PLU50_07270, partial [Pseudobdellovibrionaceae bacterium]|nr:hypothetical protein [Pseudobdellovibrionaceae bacterium]